MEGSGAVVALLQFSILPTDGTVVVMLHVLLPDTNTEGHNEVAHNSRTGQLFENLTVLNIQDALTLHL